MKTNRNLLITMILGGLWHGAAWTYVAWGTYHGLLLIGHRMMQPLLKRWLQTENPTMERIWFAIRWVAFFVLSCVGWLIFRAESMSQVWAYLRALVTTPFSRRELTSETDLLALLACAIVVFFVDLAQEFTHDRFWVFRLHVGWRAIVYASMILSFIIYGNFASESFIYFQF